MNLARMSETIATFSNPKAKELQQLVEDKLTSDRLGNIVEKLLSKAEGGDTHALDYLLNLAAMKTVMPKSVTVNQFLGPVPESQLLGISSERIQQYLSHSGETTVDAVSEGTGIEVGEVIGILADNPKRFSVNGRKCSLRMAHLDRKTK